MMLFLRVRLPGSSWSPLSKQSLASCHRERNTFTRPLGEGGGEGGGGGEGEGEGEGGGEGERARKLCTSACAPISVHCNGDTVEHFSVTVYNYSALMIIGALFSTEYLVGLMIQV